MSRKRLGCVLDRLLKRIAGRYAARRSHSA
jgi:hypothetical protein